MKTFRFIGIALFAVLMCVNLASCSSSDDDPRDDVSKKLQKSFVQVNMIMNYPGL